MRTKIKLLAAALMMTGTMALAEVSTEQLVSDLQAEGYTWIEVKRGPTQIKVEAVKGSTKVETIIDRETGAILKTESEDAGNDAGRSGVQVRDRNRDFVKVRGSDDDDDDDDSGRDDDDDDDNSGRGSDDDDDRDDDKSGRGGDDDDDHDDDKGGRGGDDDGDDD